MVVVYDHTVQEHHFFSSGTLMVLTCDLLGTKIGETAQCEHSFLKEFEARSKLMVHMYKMPETIHVTSVHIRM